MNLTTGTSSGLGKYLHKRLGGTAFNRQTLGRHKAEIIIHCAFNRTRSIDTKNLYQYYSDNILLTQELTKISHKKFIYISTVDVYPQDNKKHSEGAIIDLNKATTLYGITKLIAESLVQKNCPNFLILRCATLLGKDSRKNSLIKILKEDYPSLKISAQSEFNYILHKDVLTFIKVAMEKDLQGVYNLASSENITLQQVAKKFNKKVGFGDYVYNVGDIDNNKAATLVPVFKKTSGEIISEFANSIL